MANYTLGELQTIYDNCDPKERQWMLGHMHEGGANLNKNASYISATGIPVKYLSKYINH